MKISIGKDSVDDLLPDIYLYLERRFEFLIIEGDLQRFFIKEVIAPGGIYIVAFVFLVGALLVFLKSFWFVLIGLFVCVKSFFFLLHRLKWLCLPKLFVEGEIVNIECSNPTGCPNHDEVILRVSCKVDAGSDSRLIDYPFGCPYWGHFVGEVTFENSDVIKGERKQWTLPIPVVAVYLKNDFQSIRLLGLKK